MSRLNAAQAIQAALSQQARLDRWRIAFNIWPRSTNG